MEDLPLQSIAYTTQQIFLLLPGQAVGELLCMRGVDRPDYTTNDRDERRRRDKRQTDMQDGVVQVG